MTAAVTLVRISSKTIVMKRVLPLSIRFLHDGAPVPFGVEVRHCVDLQFPNRFIRRNGPLPWPARSPDLSCLDFYLWRHMKSLIYATPVQTEQVVVPKIAVAAGGIAQRPGVFESVRNSLGRMFLTCTSVHGTHFVK